MKIRTDFVTNSSSSSFIFREKTFADTRDKMLQISRRKKNWMNMDDPRWLVSLFDSVCGDFKPVEETDFRILMELVEWYEMEQCVFLHDGTDSRIDQIWNSHDDLLTDPQGWLHAAQIAAKDMSFSDEELKKMAGFWVLYMMEIDSWSEYDEKPLHDIYTRMELKRRCRKFIAASAEDLSFGVFWRGSTMLLGIILQNHEKMTMFAECYADMRAGEILRKVTGAKYIYYDCESADSSILEAFESSPDFMFGDCHMG